MFKLIRNLTNIIHLNIVVKAKFVPVISITIWLIWLYSCLKIVGILNGFTHTLEVKFLLFLLVSSSILWALNRLENKITLFIIRKNAIDAAIADVINEDKTK